MSFSISSRQGVRCRLLLTDCGGEALAVEAVSAVKYTIYERYLGAWNPVAGHADVTIPVASCMCCPPEEDEHLGKQYNFSWFISMKQSYPFPERGRTYVVEFEFRDVNGEAFIPKNEDGSPMFVFETY